MIKLTHSFSATADTMTRSGYVLILNGTEDYDLSDLSSLPQAIEAAEDNPAPDNGPVYTDGTDVFVSFKANQHQHDDLSHGNLMRLFDRNNNCIFEIDEFLEMVDYLNLPEAEKREYRKSVMDAFVTPLMSSEFRSLISDYTGAMTKVNKAKVIFELSDENRIKFLAEFKAAKKAWMDKGKETAA